MEGQTVRATYLQGYAARTTGGRVVLMPDQFDLLADYREPRSYLAMYLYGWGCGRRFRVRVDHEATGTGTAGTGDTVVRVV